MAAAHPLTDHDEIRAWAEARNATPACVRGTGGKGDTGMIRLDFPGFTGAGKLQEISWDEWFDSFDANNLALLVQDKTAQGGRSNFNKLVARRTAAGKQKSRRSAGGSRRTRAAGASKSSTGTRKATGRAAAGRTRSAKRTGGSRSTSRSTKRAGGRASSRSTSRKRSSSPKSRSRGASRKRSSRG